MSGDNRQDYDYSNDYYSPSYQIPQQSSGYPAYPTTTSGNIHLSASQASQQQLSYATHPSTSSSSQHDRSHASAEYVDSHNQSTDMTEEERRQFFENLNTSNPEAAQRMIFAATGAGSPSIYSTAFASITSTAPTESPPSWNRIERLTVFQRIQFLDFVNTNDPGLARELIRDENARVRGLILDGLSTAERAQNREIERARAMYEDGMPESRPVHQRRGGGVAQPRPSAGNTFEFMNRGIHDHSSWRWEPYSDRTYARRRRR